MHDLDGTAFVVDVWKKPEGEMLQGDGITQILEADSGSLWLVCAGQREIGIFQQSSMRYRKVPIKTSKPLPPRSEFNLWRDADGNVWLKTGDIGLIMRKRQVMRSEREIAARQPRAAHVQLPCYAQWDGALLLIEQVNRGVGDGLAVLQGNQLRQLFAMLVEQFRQAKQQQPALGR